MNKGVFWVGTAAVAVVALGVMAVIVATSAVPDDACSAAYRECAAMTADLVGTVDCRVEVYHCRTVGHFEFPDGSVRQFPTALSDVGED